MSHGMMFVRVGIAVLHSSCNSEHSAGPDSFQSGVGARVTISRSSNGGHQKPPAGPVLRDSKCQQVSNLKFENSTNLLSQLNFRILQDSSSYSIHFHPITIHCESEGFFRQLTGHFVGKTPASMAEATFDHGHLGHMLLGNTPENTQYHPITFKSRTEFVV